MKKVVCTLFGLIFFTLSVVVYAADPADITYTQSLTPLNGATSFKDIAEGIASWEDGLKGGGFSHYYWLNHFHKATSIDKARVKASFSIDDQDESDAKNGISLKKGQTITKSYSVVMEITKGDSTRWVYRLGIDIDYTYNPTTESDKSSYTKSYCKRTHFYELDQNNKPKKGPYPFFYLNDEPIDDKNDMFDPKEHVIELEIEKSEASSYNFTFTNDRNRVGKKENVANVQQINSVQIIQAIWWTDFESKKPNVGFPVITKAINYCINDASCTLDDNSNDECNQVELDSAKQEGKQACIDDPLSCGIGKYLIFSNNAIPVLESGSSVNVYGSNNEINKVTLKSGASAKLINFVGKNEVTVEADSTLFNVSRSGATVTFKDSNGTVLTIPATTTPQTIIFNDKRLTLVIENNKVMLGDQEITLTETEL